MQVVRIIKRHGNLNHLQISDVAVSYHRFAIAPGVYAEGRPEAEAAAMREAVTLFSIIPEFSVTNLNVPQNNGHNDTLRIDRPLQVSQNRPYKAVVTTLLNGGADSYNILVPLDGCTKPVAGGSNGEREAFDLYAEYAAIRKEGLALPTSKLNPINVPAENKQPCTRFGITDKLPILQTLYNDGDAAFIANMGAMIKPLSKHTPRSEWREPLGNYGHATIRNVLSVDAENWNAKGVVGRMINHLMQDRNGTKGYKSQMYSLRGATKLLEGAPGTPIHLSTSGVVRFPKFAQYAEGIANISKYKSRSVFAEQYIQSLTDHLYSTEELGEKMDAELQTAFAGDLGKQFEQVAKAIRMDTNLISMERAGFYAFHHGYDTHGSLNQDALLTEVNSAISTLVTSLKQQGKWNNVVLVFVSDFGRSLTGNSQGTDHGWGGNYFVLGGKVNGGQILGEFPNRLDPVHSDVSASRRGSIIPTTPWESIWNGIAEWFGVDKEGRESILPVMKNFENSSIFSAAQLFKS